MIRYRIADSRDAENLLRTRYNAVVNSGRDIYPKDVLEAWAPRINSETIEKEAEALKNPDRITIVAEDYVDNVNVGGRYCRMIGLVTLIVSSASVMQCYVLSGYGKKGIGTELMDRLEAVARGRGIRKLTISSSLMAVEFQKRRGFVPLDSYEYDLGNGLSLTCYMMEKELD